MNYRWTERYFAGKIYELKKQLQRKRMSDSDSWCTPDWLFQELNAEFNFDIDLCATKENTKCPTFCKDYLKDLIDCQVINEETGEKSRVCCYIGVCGFKCAFMNPPYSNPRPFIEKAWEDSKHCKIVCLVKCDPSTKWWATFWEYDVSMYVYSGKYGIYKTFERLEDDEDSLIRVIKYRGPKPGCEVRFFPFSYKHENDLTFALVIMDRREITCGY